MKVKLPQENIYYVGRMHKDLKGENENKDRKKKDEEEWQRNGRLKDERERGESLINPFEIPSLI